MSKAVRISTLSTQLVCLCLLAAVDRAAGAPVSLSIPGAVAVRIEPPEAVAYGARWSIDGGTLKASGESVTNLAAGTHSIHFSNLAAWLDPDALEVMVVVGKQPSVVVKYRPLGRAGDEEDDALVGGAGLDMLDGGPDDNSAIQD